VRIATIAFLARHFSRSERGATAIEYGLIASLLFLAIVGSVASLGQGVVGVLYNKIESLF
jgi:Flp pilus assembly pilin Flp